MLAAVASGGALRSVALCVEIYFLRAWGNNNNNSQKKKTPALLPLYGKSNAKWEKFTFFGIKKKRADG